MGEKFFRGGVGGPGDGFVINRDGDAAGVSTLAADLAVAVVGENGVFGALVNLGGEGAHFQLGAGGVGHAVCHGAALAGAEIDGESGGIVGQAVESGEGEGELRDGIGAALMLTAGMGAATFDFDAEGGAAFAGGNEGEVSIIRAVGLEGAARRGGCAIRPSRIPESEIATRTDASSAPYKNRRDSRARSDRPVKL